MTVLSVKRILLQYKKSILHSLTCWQKVDGSRVGSTGAQGLLFPILVSVKSWAGNLKILHKEKLAAWEVGRQD